MQVTVLDLVMRKDLLFFMIISRLIAVPLGVVFSLTVSRPKDYYSIVLIRGLSTSLFYNLVADITY